MNFKKQVLFGFMLVTAGMVCQNATAFNLLWYPLGRYEKTKDFPYNLRNVPTKAKNIYEFVKNAHKNGLKNQFEYELIKDFDNDLRKNLNLKYRMAGDAPDRRRVKYLRLHLFPEDLSKSNRKKMEEKIEKEYNALSKRATFKDINPSLAIFKERRASYEYGKLIREAIEKKSLLQRMILNIRPKLFRKTFTRIVNELEKEKREKQTTKWRYYYQEKYYSKGHGKDYARWAGGLPIREQSTWKYLKSFLPF